MRSYRPDWLSTACCVLLLCMLPSCGKQAGTALQNRLAGQSGGTGGDERSQADYRAFLPDPSRTPGDTLPVTADDVCTSGYSSRVRDVNTEEKKQVYEDYGIDHHAPREYEIDHLISLELGGSNKPKNLWPQSYKTQPWNAHVKDRLEDKLHEMVCTGQIDLKTAQREIATDWIATYRNVFHTDQPLPTGSGEAGDARAHATRAPAGETESNSGADRASGTAKKVWVNTRSGKYFLLGNRYYGNTREGEYLSEREAIRQGYQAAGGQR